MAIGTPVSLGTSAGVQTHTLTTTVAVAAGDSILVHAWVANTRTFTSVTDSVGNTYTQDQTVGTNPHMAVWSCHNALALPSGSTITANLSSATSATKGIDAMKVSGLAAASVLDQHTSSSGSTAVWSVGPTGTLAQADELAVYAITDSAGATANTPDASWSDINDFATGGGTPARMAMGYRIVSATTALTASGTMGAAAWTAVIATYKGAAAASSDSATPGTASALSVAPSARTQAAITANPAGGVSPAARAQSSVGAVAAAGVNPSARALSAVGAASTVGGSPTVATFALVGAAAAVGVDLSSATAETSTTGAAAGAGVAPASSANAEATLGVATTQGASSTDGFVETDTTLGVVAVVGLEPVSATMAAAALGAAATSSSDASASTSDFTVMGSAGASGIGPTVPVAQSFELVTLTLSTPPRPVVRVLVTASPSLTVSTRPARTLEVA